MRVVVALGGNALLKRGEPMTAERQRANVQVGAPGAGARSPREHELVRLARQRAAGRAAGAAGRRRTRTSSPTRSTSSARETEGMIGYLLEQELGNVLPSEAPLATILTMVEVDPADPAFDDPTKFVGPIYDEAEARRAGRREGLGRSSRTATSWRRVVPSPQPRRIFEIRPIRWLLEQGVVVICAGGGGIPTMYARTSERTLVGVEAVIDKDLASELLARELDADLFVMATDVDGVYDGLGHAATSGGSTG